MRNLLQQTTRTLKGMLLWEHTFPDPDKMNPHAIAAFMHCLITPSEDEDEIINIDELSAEEKAVIIGRFQQDDKFRKLIIAFVCFFCFRSASSIHMIKSNLVI
jgi:hypothetical protein